VPRRDTARGRGAWAQHLIDADMHTARLLTNFAAHDYRPTASDWLRGGGASAKQAWADSLGSKIKIKWKSQYAPIAGRSLSPSPSPKPIRYR